MDIAARLDGVIVTVRDGTSRVLCVHNDDGRLALPSGPLSSEDATLELSLRRWVREQTGLELGYAEQLYTFADRFRDPVERRGGPRVMSVAYLALTDPVDLDPSTGARWIDWHRLFPWEDWRQGQPEGLSGLRELVRQWAGDDQEKLRRAAVCFGLGVAPWDPERTLSRYELLFEAGLVVEGGDASGLGQPMAQDHRRIVATAMGRLRGKIRYRPLVFELTPETFTLSELQTIVEALVGNRLHKPNFRRLLRRTDLVEGTGRTAQSPRGRPAELFRFRQSVVAERRAPGVGFAGANWQ